MKLNKLIAVVFLMLSGWVAGAQTKKTTDVHAGMHCRTLGATMDDRRLGTSYACDGQKWIENVHNSSSFTTTASEFSCPSDGCPTFTCGNCVIWNITKPDPILKIDNPIEGKDGTTHYSFHAEKGWTCKTIFDSMNSKTMVFICTLEEPKPEPPPAPACTITPSVPSFLLGKPDPSNEMMVKPVRTVPRCPSNTTCIPDTFVPVTGVEPK